jgi:DNA-binding CsgD family transcriptional regulator
MSIKKDMTKTILIYGVSLAVGVFFLKWLEYRILIRELPIVFYVGVIAFFFTGVGVWAGLQLTRKQMPNLFEAMPFERNARTVPPGAPVHTGLAAIEKLGLSKRELEVLDLMAKGLSNQEIANSLFVSVNTIKTHSANLYVKLDVRRRTQAIQKAKELAIL